MNIFWNIQKRLEQFGSGVYDATHTKDDPTQSYLSKWISNVTGVGMQDPTQSLLYKWVQWGANLFTSWKEYLQWIWTQWQSEFDRKKEIARNFLTQKWYSPDVIENTISKIEYKPWFWTRLATGLWNRLQEAENTTERLQKEWFDPLAGKVTAKWLVTAPLSYAWDVVWTAMEPIWAAISPVVQKVIEKTGQTENVAEIGKWWEWVRQSNPNFADAIEGVMNVSSVAPLPLAKPIAGSVKQWGIATGKAIASRVEKVAPQVVQGVKTGVKSTGEWVGKVTKSLVSQQSGLWTQSIESILRKPELQWKIRSWELSAARTLEEARTSIDSLREWFRETGKMYDTIRKSNVKVPKNEAKKVILSQLESEGLSTGWKLNLVDLPVKDRSAITQALKYIDEYGDTMTPQNALSIRQKLDDLINYKSDVGSNWQRIVQWLRSKYDEFLSQKLPWLKEIDVKYAPERQFWESIRKDIYNSDGTLKDNALSVISNITNKWNESRLARMEKILPWIWEKVKALKAFEDVQNASGIKIGTYWRAATTGALALASVPVAITTWVATHPAVVARVLEWIGIASQRIKSILAKWKNITKEEADIIQKAVSETPKSKVEWIINNLSYDHKTSKLTSKTLTKNGNNSTNPISTSNKWGIGKMEWKPVTQVTTNTIKKEVVNPFEKKPYTLGIKNPIVNRSADVDSGLIEPKNFKTREQQYNKELWDFIEWKSNKTESQIKAEYKDVSDFIKKKSEYEKGMFEKSIDSLPADSNKLWNDIYYHWTSVEFAKFNRPKVLHWDIFGEWIYLTPNKSWAELYAKQSASKWWNEKIAIVKVKWKLKEIDGSNEMNIKWYTENAVKKAKKDWFDGVKIRNNLLDKWAIRWEDIIMIFNPENAIIQRFASKYKNQS